MSKSPDENRILTDIGGGLTGFGILFSYAFCVSACAGLGIASAFLCTCVCAAASLFTKNKILAPDSFLLLPVLFVIAFGSAEFLPIALLAAAGLYFAVGRALKKDFAVPDCVLAGSSLALAFAVTVMMTTLYFGIGASGTTVWGMLKSYRYLGFHANWRGVFYGTITLFTMITFPFKFKKLSRYLPAEVFSTAIPFVLNLWLNPSGETTPILEVSSLAFFPSAPGAADILPFLNMSAADAGAGIIAALKGAVCIALLLLAQNPQQKSDKNACFASCAAGSPFGVFPARLYDIYHYSFISALVTVLFAVAVCFAAPALLARVPVHSLAVVLIVSAWKNVRFKMLGECFRENAALKVITVIGIFCAFLFADLFTAFLICMLFAVVMRRLEK